VRRRLALVRARVPLLDHLIRAFQRYQADRGDRLAAGVTYFFFLSMFPILLLAVSLLGYVYGDDAQQRVLDAVGDALPSGLADQVAEVVSSAKGKAGILGLLGLLYAGLGLVDALRDALRMMWHQDPGEGNFLVKKAVDVLVLVGVLGTVGASVVVTGLVTSFSDQAIELLPGSPGTGTKVFTAVLGIVLALLADVLLFFFLFTRLTTEHAPLRQVLGGAAFGAVGFEVLKVVGGIYVNRTTSSGQTTYGTFAVVVGLLLFLYLLSRLILFAAAFTVTSKGDSDAPPSGTADDVEPQAPVQVELDLPVAVPARTDAAAGGVVLAARAIAVGGGVALAAIGAHALGTLRHVVRRD
jgi:membrane protein